MAVAIQSSSSTAWAGANNVVITKPSGLIVGDLLIAFVFYQDGGITITPPSGWTTLRTTTDGNIAIWSFYKIATSTETAATDFTFGASSSIEIGGGMVRIDGFPTSPIWTSAGATTTSTATPSFANTITPAVADSLLIMAVVCHKGTGTISTYAIATSNPTWVETFERTTADSVDYTFAVATANRTQTTATGNSSVAFTGSALSDWSGQMIAIAPSKDFSVTDTITETDSVFASLDLKVSDTITATDSLDTEENRWTNDSKNTSIWTNDDKS